jgi:hypothetical protein
MVQDLDSLAQQRSQAALQNGSQQLVFRHSTCSINLFSPCRNTHHQINDQLTEEQVIGNVK